MRRINLKSMISILSNNVLSLPPTAIEKNNYYKKGHIAFINLQHYMKIYSYFPLLHSLSFDVRKVLNIHFTAFLLHYHYCITAVSIKHHYTICTAQIPYFTSLKTDLPSAFIDLYMKRHFFTLLLSKFRGI